MSARDSDQSQLLGDSFGKIQNARVLMVGAGGIGCELLKNLVMSGFKYIETIDLDTVDLSNLNRQFLFQKQHINKPKAIVARESALKFNPNVEIVAHHASIFEKRFNLSWYRSFDIVLNALDNIAARRHVNLMCRAANVPLVESGTAGYCGQTTVHIPGLSSCYDCEPKPTPKTFPVCTIRSTPSQPIHCIVWAKTYLFSKLFRKDEDDMANQLESAASSENAEELEALRKESLELRKLIESSASSPTFARDIFDKVYGKDIQRLVDMEDLWKERKSPKPLYAEQLDDPKKGAVKKGMERDTNVWTPEQNYSVFVHSAKKLFSRLHKARKTDPEASLEFDKDDEDALDFVASAANLRSIAYSIASESRFKIKELAGNIIPAIATTNAIVAGLIVIEAIKIITGQTERCRDIFLQSSVKSKSLMVGQLPDKSKATCVVCHSNYFELMVDLKKPVTLGQVLEQVRVSLEMGKDHELSVEEGKRLLCDPDFDDNLDRTLTDLGIVDGSHIVLTSEDDDGYILSLFVSHSKEASGIQVKGNKNLRRKPNTQTPTLKRKAEDQLESETAKKQAIVIDDENAILID